MAEVRNTSLALFVSAIADKLVALDVNASQVPSPPIDGCELDRWPAPLKSTDARAVVLFVIATNTSAALFVSLGTRLKRDVNATYRPSSLIEAPRSARLRPRHRRCAVVPLRRSRMNTSLAMFVSPATRFAADD
jgi:hypothetical protein